MQQHYLYQKNYRLSKKIIHGRFNKSLFSLNAALRTAQELYTHHYVGIDVLPCDTLQQSLITNITVIETLNTIYILICYMTILLTKYTPIWGLNSTYGLCYHVTRYN